MTDIKTLDYILEIVNYRNWISHEEPVALEYSDPYNLKLGTYEISILDEKNYIVYNRANETNLLIDNSEKLLALIFTLV